MEQKWNIEIIHFTKWKNIEVYEGGVDLKFALDFKHNASLIEGLLYSITYVKSQIPLDMLTVISSKINPRKHGQMWPSPTVFMK